nr:unnamed protein product [Spirometra erinaceieuropaei]
MQPRFLLKSISGKFSSGRLIAIMGPSGAGKSTLMNVLAGFKTRNVSGQILINSKPRDLKLFRRSSCFILQDAPLLSQLTVAEAMFCSSQLNLPRHLSSEQRTAVIDEILQVLGLSESKTTRTSALSGGQRKRLSIAQEMVNNPPIMFFDEPTSGLDSASSLQCIAALQTIARQGRTVICTIHQPSAKVFDMFDELYFLYDGQCVYRGPVRYLVPYLTSQNLHCPRYHNPSDFLMDIASGGSSGGLSVLLRAVVDGRLEEELEKIRRSSPTQVEDHGLLELDSAQSSTSKAQPPPMDDNLSRATPPTSSLQHLHDQSGHAFEVGLFHQTSVLFRRTMICIWRDTVCLFFMENLIHL